MEQRERTIIDGQQNQMYVRHLTLRGTNYEIGYRLGQMAIQRHERDAETHLRSDPRYVRIRRQYLQQTYPIHYQRMQGVAAAFGLNVNDDNYDFSMLLYGIDVPRLTESSGIPAVGCSVVYYPPASTASGAAYLSRNFDFSVGSIADQFGFPQPTAVEIEPMVRHPYVLELHPTDGGYRSLAIQAFDLLSGTLDGMNEAGLVVSIMADEEAMAELYEPHLGPPRAVGLHELQVMRYLLDTCSTMDEAQDALLLVKQYYQFAPCHYIIGDRHGRSFVYEHSTGRNVQHLIGGNARPQVVTNFQLHQHFSREERSSNGLPLQTDAFRRYQMLSRLLEKQTGDYTEAMMKANNACVNILEMFKLLGHLPASQTIAGGVLTRTLWHSLYNLDKLTVAFNFYLGEAGGESMPQEIRSDYYEFFLATLPAKEHAAETGGARESESLGP